MVTLTRLRAKDVPDMDRGGSKNNVSDPYLSFAVLDEHGEVVDEARTPHQENMRNPKWEESLRLFLPDNDAAKTGRTAPVPVLLTLMDRNKKKADALIGELLVKLTVGSGKVKVEVPSRSVSSFRSFVHFRYEVVPQMYFEQVEYVRVVGEAESDDDDL